MTPALRAQAQIFRGTGVALVTPFLHSGAVDFGALQRLVEFVLTGVDYLVVLGTTAEVATLSEEETDLVVETIMASNDGRTPVLIGCGGNDTARVVAQVRERVAVFRPQGVMSVCPYYNKPSQEGLYRHFSTVAEACGDTPLILYNVPGRTASNLLPETVLRLAETCPNIVGIKEASGNLEQAADIVADRPEDFLVLSGDDPLALPGIALGLQGCISVLANAFPVETGNLVRNALEGKYDEARRLHYQLRPAGKLAFAEGNPTGVKALLAAWGIGTATVRLPLAEASDDLKQRIRALVVGA